MPPEIEQAGATATAEPQTPPADQQSEPLFDFSAAFSDAPPPIPPAPVAETPAEVPVPVTAAAEPADDEDEDETPPAAEAKDGEEAPKLSRRQRAEQDRQAREAEYSKRAETAESRVKEFEQWQATQQATADSLHASMAQLVGTQAEFDRLSAALSSDITFEEQETLDRWKGWRTALAPIGDWLIGLMETDAKQVADTLGIAPERLSGVVRRGMLRGLLTDVVTAAEARAESRAKTTADQQLVARDERIQTLEAELRDLRTKHAAETRPLAVGGTSAPASSRNGSGRFDPTRTPDEMFKSAFS